MRRPLSKGENEPSPFQSDLVSDDRDRSEDAKAARLARLQPDAAERMATNDELARIRQENFETFPLPSDILANDEIRECDKS